MRACICYFCLCISRDGAILQHNSSYTVAYNGYIQTDLAQSNNVYLFSLVVLHLICRPLEIPSFELWALYSCCSKPFNPCCTTIRSVVQNHLNCALQNHSNWVANHSNHVAKAFESRVAKPFESRCKTIRIACCKPFESHCKTIRIARCKTIRIVHCKTIWITVQNHLMLN